MRVELGRLPAGAVHRGQPFEAERSGRSLAFPFDADRPVARYRRSNSGVLGQIRDIDEPLAVVWVAMLGQVVTQPQAVELANFTVRPFDDERIGRARDAPRRGSLAHGRCLPMAAAWALKKYSRPAPSAASAL